MISILWQLPLLLLTIPMMVLTAQLLACLPARRPRPPVQQARPPLAVLVPAHNEAAGMKTTLDAIRCQLTPADLLVVVADNCDDDTAAAAGDAIVIERHDTARQGKAYALACGLAWLAQQPPAVTICIDADCMPDAHALDHLARHCVDSGRPVQACYLMHAGADAPPQRRVAEFAWLVKNCLRALGRERLGMACQLTGSGMALPAQLLSTLPLQHHLAEDLALGLALAAQGHAPLYCHDAVLRSSFPERAVAAQGQRTRWVHGHLHLLLHDGPRYLLLAARRRDPALAGLALDLCIPPLSLLLMLTALACLPPLLMWCFADGAPPWLLLPPLLLLASLLAAWWRHGRTVLPPRCALAALSYMLGKLPLYLRYLTRRQRDWISTRRD